MWPMSARLLLVCASVWYLLLAIACFGARVRKTKMGLFHSVKVEWLGKKEMAHGHENNNSKRGFTNQFSTNTDAWDTHANVFLLSPRIAIFCFDNDALSLSLPSAYHDDCTTFVIVFRVSRKCALLREASSSFNCIVATCNVASEWVRGREKSLPDFPFMACW